jgi:hypothetical protein
MKTIEILDAEGAVQNRIVADEEFAQMHHPDHWRLAADQPEDAPAPAPLRHISVGAFYDRFGPQKWAILADQSPAVQAVVRDASVRKYIDLDNSDLPAGLQIIVTAGHPIDPAAIIGAPVEGSELP